jgi:hypothetical protein
VLALFQGGYLDIKPAGVGMRTRSIAGAAPSLWDDGESIWDDGFSLWDGYQGGKRVKTIWDTATGPTPWDNGLTLWDVK